MASLPRIKGHALEARQLRRQPHHAWMLFAHGIPAPHLLESPNAIRKLRIAPRRQSNPAAMPLKAVERAHQKANRSAKGAIAARCDSRRA